jgi:hypothetical protein
MERQQNTEVAGSYFSQRDLFRQLGLCRSSSEKRLDIFHFMVGFCESAQRSSSKESNNIGVSIDTNQVEKFNLIVQNQIDSIPKTDIISRDILTRVSKYVGVDGCKMANLLTKDERSFMDEDGVDIFSGWGSLIQLKKRKRVSKQFDNIVKRIPGSIYKKNYIEISREAVVGACVALQQEYEKIINGPNGCDFSFAGVASSLEVKLERWAKRPFGLGWRKGRIDYISKVARTGEWREENSVK